MITAISNRKGGVGKTTIAVHLAAALARAGRRVLIVDTDAQGHVAAWLNLDKDDALFRVVTGQQPLRQAAQTLPREAWTRTPSHAGGELAVLPGYLWNARLHTYPDPNRLAAIMREASSYYHDVLIDTAPTFSANEAAVLSAAEAVLYVVEPSYLALDGLNDALSERERHRPSVRMMGVVPTRCHLRTRATQQQLADLNAALPGQIWQPIAHSTAWNDAAAAGVLVHIAYPALLPVVDELAVQYLQRNP